MTSHAAHGKWCALRLCEHPTELGNLGTASTLHDQLLGEVCVFLVMLEKCFFLFECTWALVFLQEVLKICSVLVLVMVYHDHVFPCSSACSTLTLYK